ERRDPLAGSHVRNVARAVAPRRDEELAARVEASTVDPRIVRHRSRELEGIDASHAHGAVPRGRDDEAAIRTEADRVRIVLVSIAPLCEHRLERPGADRPVEGDGGDAPTVASEYGALHSILVTDELDEHLTGRR